jgi:hypothetical protein
MADKFPIPTLEDRFRRHHTLFLTKAKELGSMERLESWVLSILWDDLENAEIVRVPALLRSDAELMAGCSASRNTNGQVHPITPLSTGGTPTQTSAQQEIRHSGNRGHHGSNHIPQWDKATKSA